MRRVVAIGIGLLLGLVAAEMALRVAGRADADGQFTVLGQTLRPYHLPVAKVRARIANLPADGLFEADPELGWRPRPGHRRAGSPYEISRQGLRADRDHDEAPGAGVLRIGTFGDSFTFGDELPLAATWPAQLEEILVDDGRAAEVLNFGVNGYGLDQALLRFRKDGARFDLDLVVVGLQPENLLRNLNVFRPIYFANTSLPFSKPRFILEGDGMRLVNSPTVPPEELADTLADLPNLALAAHERFLDPGYTRHWWLRSRALALFATQLPHENPVRAFRLTPEAHELARRILRAFRTEASRIGASTLVVLLPPRDALESLLSSRPVWFQELVEDLGGDLVRPDQTLSAISADDFQPKGHYGPRLNRHVAKALARKIDGTFPRPARPTPAHGRGTDETASAGAEE